jgi:hypothetical protein
MLFSPPPPFRRQRLTLAADFRLLLPSPRYRQTHKRQPQAQQRFAFYFSPPRQS